MSVEALQERVAMFSLVLAELPDFKYLGVDPILRTQTHEVDWQEGAEIGKALGETLIRYRKLTGIGRGLAAPQMGVDKSVMVTYVDDAVQIYINPRITKQSETTNLYRELCLSSGFMWADVERYESITLEWTDEKGERHEQTFDGFKARLLQHEEAHLRGICNLDQCVPGTIGFQISDPLKEQLRSKS